MKARWLMYDKLHKCFDGLKFVDASDLPIAACKFKLPVKWLSLSFPSPPTLQLNPLAGLFTSALDFLAHVLGHQGTSAKWCCVFCLAEQSNLGQTFLLGCNIPCVSKLIGDLSLATM
jgi:hypothetical protein